MMSAVTESVRESVPDGLPGNPAAAVSGWITRHKWVTRFLALEVVLFAIAALGEATLPPKAGSLLAAMLASLGILGLTVVVLYGVYAVLQRLTGPGGLVDSARAVLLR